MARSLVQDAWTTANARLGFTPVGMDHTGAGAPSLLRTVLSAEEEEPEPEEMSSASVGLQDDWSRFESICEALLADTPEVTPVASSPVSIVPETAGAVVGSEVATHSQ